MNNQIQWTFSLVGTALLFFLGAALFITAPLASAETVVSNSVSISSNGTNHSSVTTIINGEVVEDWSETSTEPIEYSSIHKVTSSTTSSTTDSLSTTDRDRLQTIIAHLQALISLYVSLLTY